MAISEIFSLKSGDFWRIYFHSILFMRHNGIFWNQAVKIRPKQNANGDGPQCFLFGEFSQPGDKKKREILRFIKKLPYIDQKNLEVARFRQCVPVGRQN
jgi:hypothetical protein